MSRWQEFGFPNQLKFTSPLKAMQGITLAVAERLRQSYPSLAENWYAGNRYTAPFIYRTLASLYPIEYGLESHYLSQGSIFPLALPNNALLNPLSSLPRVSLSNPSRTICGFWDFSKVPSGVKELSEEEYLQSWRTDSAGNSYCSAEEECRFNTAETETLPENFRFQYAFSERYFLYLYEKINPLKSYLCFRVREQQGGHLIYCYSAESIQNLTFSD